jgi:lactate dehydrogenase-like 2-hydroxyacid dehydrogenase
MRATHHRIGKQQLEQMKKNSYLINTSRGLIVDEAAFYEALKNRTIVSAGLEVFEKEPIDHSNPIIELDNIVMTPHIASASIDTRTIMVSINLVVVLIEETPPNLVNLKVTKKLTK